MPEIDESYPPLTAGAQRLVDLALRQQAESNSPELGVFHWLLALLERHSAMAEAVAKGLVAEGKGDLSHLKISPIDGRTNSDDVVDSAWR